MNFDIWHVAIPVMDLKASVRFYCEGLGFKLIGFNEEGNKQQAFVQFNSKPFTIELFQQAQPSELRPHHLAFECADLDAVYEDLNKRGQVPNLEPIVDFENGVRYLAVKDPDGVPLEFFQGRELFDRSIRA